VDVRAKERSQKPGVRKLCIVDGAHKFGLRG